MRRDRRTALLIGLWAACVVVIGGAAVLVPARADAVAPSPLDLMVGWTLLVAGLACFRSATAAVLLTAAGVTWVAVGLAALIDGPLGSGLPRLALAPTAFLLLIVALLPRGRLAGPLAWGQALVLIAVTAIGGAGADAYAMAVLGSTVLVPSVARTNRRHRDRSGTVQLLVGGGILLAGVLVSTGVGAPELAVDIHASVMIGGATAVAWQLARPAAIPAEALELGEPLSIGRALGEMVGTGPVEVAFPTHDGSWIDPAGDQVQPDPSRGEVLDHDGSLLPRSTPSGGRSGNPTRRYAGSSRPPHAVAGCARVFGARPARSSGPADGSRRRRTRSGRGWRLASMPDRSTGWRRSASCCMRVGSDQPIEQGRWSDSTRRRPCSTTSSSVSIRPPRSRTSSRHSAASSRPMADACRSAGPTMSRSRPTYAARSGSPARRRCTNVAKHAPDAGRTSPWTSATTSCG